MIELGPTVVVNIRLVAPGSYVYVGRRGRGQDGYFGNPFGRVTSAGITGTDGHELDGLELFDFYFLGRVEKDLTFRRRVLTELRGHVLGCFCVDKKGEGPCHAWTIARWCDDAPGRWKDHCRACRECEIGASQTITNYRCERGKVLVAEASPHYAAAIRQARGSNV